MAGRCQTYAMSSERVLPRSVLLSIWIEHLEIGAVPLEKSLQAVQGDDEPHTVVWPNGLHTRLGELISSWTASSRQVAAVLPVAGDLSGLAGPRQVNTAAVEAGEGVMFSNESGTFAAIPQVTPFGSHLEPGHLVEWHVLEANTWQQRFLGTIGHWREAQRHLKNELERSIERLMILDVAHWREELAVEVEALRGVTRIPDPLPLTIDAERSQLLASGWRLAGIADLGQTSDGAAVSGWEADRRREALSSIETAARRAVSAATFATPSLM